MSSQKSLVKEKSVQNEPIAIVGMACRFPGGLDNISKLLKALKTKYNAIDTIPSERWNVDFYHSSNPSVKGKAYMHRGGFLKHNVSKFDPSFFGISPRDAENMDPQQRLLLEVVWESFENSGLVLPDYAGKQVGVYVGGFMLDHMITQMSTANRTMINQHTPTGMMMTMLSNRISHVFDFRGPSLSIDTACSSSLVSFHYACQDIWNGTTQMAIAGGVNVMLRPEYPIGMCKGQFLSRDGECKSFDARADGYGRGEGAGVVLLKPLAAALADGDPILATVVGTGSNQDGHTPGISMPSGEAQSALIREVWERYQIDPTMVRCVECHGTGTAIGDPTEAKAIGSTYGMARGEIAPVVIGSVKSSIGHTEAAAGIAGVIKAVLTLMNRQALPLANLQEPNPNIPFKDLNLRLADDLIPLGEEDEQFCVAVNSFGYGGTNAHVVLQTAPSEKVDQIDECLPEKPLPVHFLPLSARNPKAIGALAKQYAEQLKGDVSLEDFLYSASLRRAHLTHRAVVKGEDRAQLIAALESLANNEENDDIIQGLQPFQGHRKPVFVFTGMGPQWWGMGRALYESVPIYRAAVEEADSAFQKAAGFSILAEMLKDEETSQIARTEIAQPANLVLQIGVLAVLRAAGIEPGAIVGHSVGELGSAYAAGVLTLEDVMTVAYHRSRLQATRAGTGGMLAVGLGKEQVLERISHCLDRVAIAAVNGPSNVTLSGDIKELETLAVSLNEEEIFHRMLAVEVPYHSPMMDPIKEEMLQSLAHIRPNEPKVPLYSTVTGDKVEGITYDADYWFLNTRQSVEFSAAIMAILEADFNTFLEVGPHPVLANSIRDCIQALDKDCRTIFTLRRKMPDQSTLYRSIAGVYTSGCEIDWRIHNGQGKWVTLPNYPWQRERLWLENERATQERKAPIENPILGLQEAPATPAWRNDIDHESLQYLQDHVVTGVPILPAAAYIESLLELTSLQAEQDATLIIRDLEIMAPMLISEDRGLDAVTLYDVFTRVATIRSLKNGSLGKGQLHITAKIANVAHCSPKLVDIQELSKRTTESIDIAQFYQQLDRLNLSYGKAFQTVREMRVSREHRQVLSRIEMEPTLSKNKQLDGYKIHPTVLDACFQTQIALLESLANTYLPTGFQEMCVYVSQVPERIWCICDLVEQTEQKIDCNLTLIDDEGQVLAVIRGMRSTAAGQQARTDRFGDPVKKQILTYEWSYGETLTEPKRLGYWLVVGAEAKITQQVCNRLENYGVIQAFPVVIESDNAASLEQAKSYLQEHAELDGIVFLHGLSAMPATGDPTAETAVETLIAFSQALIKKNYERWPRVYAVTQAAFSVSETETTIYPGQSAINGFARVAFNELEGLRFSSIDLPAKLSEEAWDSLAMELLCDDSHDEVALRGTLRLVSELTDSSLLSADRVHYTGLDDTHPIDVRPVKPDVESVGVSRILEKSTVPLEEGNIHLRVEATLAPYKLLLEASEADNVEPLIEVVGEVIAVGSEVKDLTPGTRVCGFAPVDVTSHYSGPREQFYLQPIASETDAVSLVSTLGLATRVQLAMSRIDLADIATALVYANPLGLMLADELERQGVKVVLVSDAIDKLEFKIVDRYTVFPLSPEGLYEAKMQATQGLGCDLLVIPAQQWFQSFDLSVLRTGGSLVGTDTTAYPLTVESHQVIRTDLKLYLQRPQRLLRSLATAVEQFEQSLITPKRSLNVSVHDIAWQKLGLSSSVPNVALTFETKGQDLPVVQADRSDFDTAGTYLITGGFGGFGQKTAEWLVQKGIRFLVLTGRSGANTPEKQAFVERLNELKVTVKAAACDTSNLSQLTDLFAEIDEAMPPLKGVFHSGALILDQPIEEIDQDTFHKVMRSKALGAWNLHQVTKDLALDHFVLYSSIANLVGNTRQAAYSAANGFLNGLAHMRRAQGLAAVSVNWGAISDVGVVAQDETLEQFLRYTGLRGIEAAEALSVLDVAIAREVTQFGVSLISSWADWARYETRGATSPRFKTLIASDTDQQDNSVRDLLIEELSPLSSDEQIEVLGKLIIEIIASVLKADPEGISLDAAVSQLGVDSLMATELQLQLEGNLGLNISIMELLGDGTVRTFARKSLASLFEPVESLV